MDTGIDVTEIFANGFDNDREGWMLVEGDGNFESAVFGADGWIILRSTPSMKYHPGKNETDRRLSWPFGPFFLFFQLSLLLES